MVVTENIATFRKASFGGPVGVRARQLSPNWGSWIAIWDRRGRVAHASPGSKCETVVVGGHNRMVATALANLSPMGLAKLEMVKMQNESHDALCTNDPAMAPRALCN
jgi:hypothetical protein